MELQAPDYVILIVEDLGPAKSHKAAENHLEYLIRLGRLSSLSRGGRVVTAQSTTTERSQVNKSGQVRWFVMVEGEWKLLEKLNLPCDSFRELRTHFQLNLDESCFMCSDGELKIMGDAERQKHDKNTSDSRTSITVLRVGAAGGEKGPVVFVVKGKGKVKSMFSDARLVKHYGLPEGSTVIMNDSAYMDDETCEAVVEKLAPAIRKMKVSRMRLLLLYIFNHVLTQFYISSFFSTFAIIQSGGSSSLMTGSSLT